MNGGNYSVTGGFWSLLAVVQTPGAPLLTIQLTTTNTAVINWPVSSPTFNLQKNSALGTANWGSVTNVPAVVGGQNQVIIAPPTGNWYFRLKYP